MEEREHGFPYVSVAIVAGAAIFLGHMAVVALPAVIAGLPTAGLVVVGVVGSVVAAVRWL
jgi:hypothetical protein